MNMSSTPSLTHPVILGAFGVTAVGLPTVIGLTLGWKFAALVAVAILFAIILIILYWMYTQLQAERKRNKADKSMRKSGSNNAVEGMAYDDDRATLESLRDNFYRGWDFYKDNIGDPYKRPWYLIIGEPASGKTHAIRNCGVDMPPELEQGQQGVDGTLNMNWWFTDDAIILDTAGRMVFNVNDEEAKKQWAEFLRILKNCRPHCPINGLMLTIPVTSLLADDEGKIQAKAEKIAAEIARIREQLSVRFPVFIFLTKCDRINGFREFFSGEQQLEQLVGWNHTASLDDSFKPKDVIQHIDYICNKIESRRMNELLNPSPRIENGNRLDEVDALFTFPQTLRETIAPALAKYTETIFKPGRYDRDNKKKNDPLFVRGIYFTSAEETGAVLDKELAEVLNVGLSSLEDEDSKLWRQNRRLFLKELFSKKIFSESGLVTSHGNVSKATRRTRLALVSAGVLCSVCLAVATWFSYVSLQNAIGYLAEDYANWVETLNTQSKYDDFVLIKPYPDSTGKLKPIQLSSDLVNEDRSSEDDDSWADPIEQLVNSYELTQADIRPKSIYGLFSMDQAGVLGQERRLAHQSIIMNSFLSETFKEAAKELKKDATYWPNDRQALAALAQVMRVLISPNLGWNENSSIRSDNPANIQESTEIGDHFKESDSDTGVIISGKGDGAVDLNNVEINTVLKYLSYYGNLSDGVVLKERADILNQLAASAFMEPLSTSWPGGLIDLDAIDAALSDFEKDWNNFNAADEAETRTVATIYRWLNALNRVDESEKLLRELANNESLPYTQPAQDDLRQNWRSKYSEHQLRLEAYQSVTNDLKSEISLGIGVGALNKITDLNALLDIAEAQLATDLETDISTLKNAIAISDENALSFNDEIKDWLKKTNLELNSISDQSSDIIRKSMAGLRSSLERQSLAQIEFQAIKQSGAGTVNSFARRNGIYKKLDEFLATQSSESGVRMLAEEFLAFDDIDRNSDKLSAILNSFPNDLLSDDMSDGNVSSKPLGSTLQPFQVIRLAAARENRLLLIKKQINALPDRLDGIKNAVRQKAVDEKETAGDEIVFQGNLLKDIVFNPPYLPLSQGYKKTVDLNQAQSDDWSESIDYHPQTMSALLGEFGQIYSMLVNNAKVEPEQSVLHPESLLNTELWKKTLINVRLYLNDYCEFWLISAADQGRFAKSVEGAMPWSDYQRLLYDLSRQEESEGVLDTLQSVIVYRQFALNQLEDYLVVMRDADEAMLNANDFDLRDFKDYQNQLSEEKQAVSTLLSSAGDTRSNRNDPFKAFLRAWANIGIDPDEDSKVSTVWSASFELSDLWNGDETKALADLFAIATPKIRAEYRQGKVISSNYLYDFVDYTIDQILNSHELKNPQAWARLASAAKFPAVWPTNSFNLRGTVFKGVEPNSSRLLTMRNEREFQQFRDQLTDLLKPLSGLENYGASPIVFKQQDDDRYVVFSEKIDTLFKRLNEVAGPRFKTAQKISNISDWILGADKQSPVRMLFTPTHRYVTQGSRALMLSIDGKEIPKANNEPYNRYNIIQNGRPLGKEPQTIRSSPTDFLAYFDTNQLAVPVSMHEAVTIEFISNSRSSFAVNFQAYHVLAMLLHPQTKPESINGKTVWQVPIIFDTGPESQQVMWLGVFFEPDLPLSNLKDWPLKIDLGG